MIENLIKSIRNHAENVGMFKTLQNEAHRIGDWESYNRCQDNIVRVNAIIESRIAQLHEAVEGATV